MNMMRTWVTGICILFISFYFPAVTTAQQRSAATASRDSGLSIPNAFKMSCGLDQMLTELRKNPAFVAIENQANSDITRRVLGGPVGPTDTVVLPVVFHIINPNPALITDAMIDAAVVDLNNAFGKRNNYAASKGADTRIRFALARKDPNGGNTRGINRVISYYSNKLDMYAEDGALKSRHVWNPAKYINIWVVTDIVGEIGASFSCGIWTRMNAGAYATMPTTGQVGTQQDGIVVTGFGPMLAHEMGHYLGLYHTFEGGCNNNNCLTDGDRVCDTPPDGNLNGAPSCSAPGNSCSSDTLSNYSNGFFPRDTTDQIANFMDYGNSACSNQFTEGQGERMRATLNTLRTALVQDVLALPCPSEAGVTASFTRTLVYPKVSDQITFTNTSTGATNYKWLVNDALIATGPFTTKVIPPNTLPKGVATKFTVLAYNADATCYSSFSDFIFVNCGVQARFYGNKRFIASKTNILLDTILFTNNTYAENPSNLKFRWAITNNQAFNFHDTVSNAAVGGANDLGFVFPNPGVYFVKLIAKDTVSGCVDSTFQPSQVSVGDPTADLTMYLLNASCYQDTKVRVQYYVCNNGYASMPANTPITFYDADPRLGNAKKIGSTVLIPDSLTGYCCGRVYTEIIDVGYRSINQIFSVVNDNGTSNPFHLPNAGLPEKDYTNNYSTLKDFKFKVSVTPASAVLEPGDTLLLSASIIPVSSPATYLWSAQARLSCSTCRTPFLYADSNITKRVIATNNYQCNDTAYVDIQVPPADDYTITVNNIACVPQQDSLTVNFTVNNSFKRGIIPKNLAISFYKNDPATSNGVLLRAVFNVPDSVLAKQRSYSCRIKKLPGQTLLYASVNDNGANIPISLASTVLLEKNYSNNLSTFLYQPVNNVIDTAICTGEKFLTYNTTGTFIDNYTTKNGCDSQRIIHLTVRSIAITTTTLNVAICAGETYAGYSVTGTYVDVYKGVNSCDSIRTLNLTVNPIVNKTYNIQICKGDTYLAAGKLQSQTGKYVDTTKSWLGCDSITTTFLIVNQPPADFLPLDTMMCIGKVLPIDLSRYTSIAWNTGSTSPSFIIMDPGTYSAKVVDRNGCNGEDSVNVGYQKCIAVQVPTAFSPNHDGKNDVFRPVIPVALKNYRLQIYNRYGFLLFESTQYHEGWNGIYKGEMQSNGTYVYFISFVDEDGFPVVKKGTFVLIK